MEKVGRKIFRDELGEIEDVDPVVVLDDETEEIVLKVTTNDTVEEVSTVCKKPKRTMFFAGKTLTIEE